MFDRGALGYHPTMQQDAAPEPSVMTIRSGRPGAA
jgi:hypothetical protein